MTVIQPVGGGSASMPEVDISSEITLDASNIPISSTNGMGFVCSAINSYVYKMKCLVDNTIFLTAIPNAYYKSAGSLTSIIYKKNVSSLLVDAVKDIITPLGDGTYYIIFGCSEGSSGGIGKVMTSNYSDSIITRFNVNNGTVTAGTVYEYCSLSSTITTFKLRICGITKI